MSERVLYLDLVGGAAGDMLLAALLDLGASLEEVRGAVDALGLDGVELELQPVLPAGLRALRLDVTVHGRLGDSLEPADASPLAGGPVGLAHVHGTSSAHAPRASSTAGHGAGAGHVHAHGAVPRRDSGSSHAHEHAGHHHAHGHRSYRDVRELIAKANLRPVVAQLAQDAFRRLAEAEAAAHGVEVEQVVFHEVGADDALADIVGTAAALEQLAPDRVVVSPLPLGRGLIRGAHGPIPLPAPATLAILAGRPTVATELVGETVTPTGAALLTAMADEFGPLPAMTLDRIGVGAGRKVWLDRPNVVRAILGTGEVSKGEDAVVQLDTNLDDMSPEHLGPLFDAVFAAGAVDVWAQPAVFKKGRSGWVVSALSPQAEFDAVTQAFFRHSTTLGVRFSTLRRRVLERSFETVHTEFGDIRVKRSPRPGTIDHVKPEHDDVAAAARRAGVPLREVEDAVTRALARD